ncbi:unnamed protein product [Prunus armeniaca]
MTQQLEPQKAAYSFWISRLVYTNGGDAILVLASNAIHFLWKWPKDLNSGGAATPKVHPNLWKPRSG